MNRIYNRLLHKLARQFNIELRTDIALSRDEASRFLPWIIALMVYLSALILAGSFTLNSTITAGRSTQNDAFSLQLPHINEKDHEITDKVLALIKATPGVEDAELLSSDHIQKIVEPWLGKNDALNNIPLPVIIEAKVKDGADMDFETLRARVAAIVPGATLDDHKKWMAQFSAFISVIQMTLVGIALLIISTTASIVIFACKTSLKIHRNTVNLLHRLGAMDTYIASQFQNYTALLTLKGSFIGSGFAAITLLLLHVMAHHINSPLFPAFSLSIFHWVILFTLPLLMSGLALSVARVSVLNNLSKAP